MQSKHVYKLYNTKSENRMTVTVEGTKDSKAQAIKLAIAKHKKVMKECNKPSNWKVEKMQVSNKVAYSINPKSKQPKAKSKQLMRSN